MPVPTFICPDETPPTNWLSLTNTPGPYQLNSELEFMAEIYGEFMDVSNENSFTGKVFFVNKGTYISVDIYSALPNIVMVRTMLVNLDTLTPSAFAEQCFLQCLADAELSGIKPYPGELGFTYPF